MKNIEFPYKSKLQFDSMLKYWDKSFDKKDYTELLNSKEPKNWIKSNPEKAKQLLSILFPIAQDQTEIVAAMPPFQHESFYGTEGYYNIFPQDELFNDAHSGLFDLSMRDGKIIKAGFLILEEFYNYDVQLDKDILFNIKDPKSGLEGIYKFTADERFFEIEASPEAKKPSEQTIKRLIEDKYNVDAWLEALPPEHYCFKGFMVMRLTDVTASEMISSIKAELLQKDAVLQEEVFLKIQNSFRSIFKSSGIKLGLAFFDLENKLVTPSKSGWNSVIIDCDTRPACTYHDKSIYAKAFSEKRAINVENLKEHEHITPVEQNLIDAGIESIVVAPLISNDEVIGMLEIACNKVGTMNPINSHYLDTLLPIFVIAVERVLDDMDAEVRSIIQQEFTSIHPTVNWKFYEEGLRVLEKRRNGASKRAGEIVFENVHPLFGLSDIRNSSEIRSKAIKEDLLENINLVENLLTNILRKKDLEVLKEYVLKLEESKAQFIDKATSDYESGAIKLIHNEINPIIKYFANQDDEIKELYKEYQQKLGEEEILATRRKSFENSVNQLNQMLATHLLEKQETIQKIFPHYFEFFKTDGIEYNLYVGQSLVKDREYHPIFLKNLRLWQLLLTAEVAVLSEELKSSLSTPLSLAHLILVQNDAIDIKFRQDEKRFDVDGAYNVRYEIVKKRIDKARILNSKERVTQPGKIAIIYSQQAEIDDYYRYIHYLQKKQILEEGIENLELEELPGVSGLKALRVQVRMDHKFESWSSLSLQSILADLEITSQANQ